MSDVSANFSLMKTIDTRLASIRQGGADVWIAGGATSADVEMLESALRTQLPPSYVLFLRTYGAFFIGDRAVSGIIESSPLSEGGGSTFGDTMRFRESPNFPPSFIVISEHEDGAYCIDTTRVTAEGECVVVNFEFGAEQHKVPVADNFLDWLMRFYLGSSRG